MGKYNGAVVTTAGQNVIAQAITGTELTWTVMRTSSVAIPQGTDLTTLTSLSGIEQTSNITDASVYGNNVIQLSSRFSNTGIATVYYIQTVGIYGQLAGGAETLIAVMTAVTPDEMPVYDPDSPSAFIFNTQITVQNADAVTMTVNDTGTATVADLNRKVDINGGDISNTVVNTVTASTADFPVPAVGDTSKTILGKIIKWFGDMSALVATKFNAANVVNNLTTTSSGYALDARQGKALNDTKLNVENVVNNLTTTASGYALDARQGKALNDALASLSANVVTDASPFYLHDQWLTPNFALNEVALLLCFSISNGNVGSAYVGMVAIGSATSPGQPEKTSKVFDIYGNKTDLGLTFRWNSTTSLGINVDSSHWAYVAVLHAGKNVKNR